MTEKPVIPTPKPVGTFTNSAGETYPIHGLSPLLLEKLGKAVEADYTKSGKTLLSHPTYEVKTASGETEIHEHDATTLVVPDDPLQTKLNQERWQEYSKQVAALETELSTRTMKLVLLAVQAKPTSEWREEMAMLGIPTFVENSTAERYAFIETHVIQCPGDLSKLMAMVFRLAGIISEEAIADAEATFQGVMERAFTEAGKQSPEKQRVDSQSILQ